MKAFNNFKYFIIEGVKNIFLHGFMSISAIGIIAACFAVTGSFALLAMNVDRLAKSVQSQSQINVFLQEDVSDEDAIALKSTIEAIPHVLDVQYVTKQQALEEYKESLGEDSGFLDGLEQDNPLRNEYRIKLDDLEYHESIVTSLESLEEIASIEDRKDISSKLIMIRRLINAVSITLVAMLGGISIFIISNAVKLATFSRREEIAIMKMVGATNSFVRWPFIIEGLLLGELGAGVSFFFQWGFYRFLKELVSTEIGFLEIYTFSEISFEILTILLVCGAVVGAGGSVMAIRKFLKV